MRIGGVFRKLSDNTCFLAKIRFVDIFFFFLTIYCFLKRKRLLSSCAGLARHVPTRAQLHGWLGPAQAHQCRHVGPGPAQAARKAVQAIGPDAAWFKHSHARRGPDPTRPSPTWPAYSAQAIKLVRIRFINKKGKIIDLQHDLNLQPVSSRTIALQPNYTEHFISSCRSISFEQFLRAA